MKIITTFLLLNLLCTPLLAQSRDTIQKPKYAVSVVCVGNRSDSYWVGEGPKMRAIAYDEGAAPPPNLSLTTTSKESSATGQKDKNKSLRISLNSPTSYATISSNVCSIKTQQTNGEKTTYSNYASVTLPERIAPYSVVLARPPRAKTWKKPQLIVLSDAKEVFPEGALRVVNVSDRTVVVQVNGKSVASLKAAENIVLKDITTSENQKLVSVIYLHKEKKTYAFRKLLSSSSKKRQTIACFYAPEKSKPLLATIFSTSEYDPSQSTNTSTTNIQN